jgi:hypothetical protein
VYVCLGILSDVKRACVWRAVRDGIATGKQAKTMIALPSVSGTWLLSAVTRHCTEAWQRVNAMLPIIN